MNNFALSPDDLPDNDTSLSAQLIAYDLSNSFSHHFYQQCDRQVQQLLSKCHWYLTLSGSAFTLVIECPSNQINWLILKNLVIIAAGFKQWVKSGRIRVSPPTQGANPFEMRVDEIAVFQGF